MSPPFHRHRSDVIERPAQRVATDHHAVNAPHTVRLARQKRRLVRPFPINRQAAVDGHPEVLEVVREPTDVTVP